MPERMAAGYLVTMLRPHLDDLPVVPCPEGFTIRNLTPAEGEVWLSIWTEAETFERMPAEAWIREFGHRPDEVSRRCVIAEDAAGRAVATASGWFTERYGLDFGQVHWVATRPAFEGRGLGKALVAHVLVQLARWHERALLDTQDQRLPAISLYLKFGFVPDLAPPGARTVWEGIHTRLPHPAVREALDG